MCMREQGVMLLGQVSIYIYIYVGINIYVCGQKIFNRTLAFDSPFQTFTVGLLVEFID